MEIVNIDESIVEALYTLYQKNKGTVMKNLAINEDQEAIKSIVSRFINVKKYHYGNLFWHTEPFTVHADISEKKRSILLIPIMAHPDQKFIIFDQTTSSKVPISWIGSEFDSLNEEELKERYYINSVRHKPEDDSTVSGLTGKDIDDELMQYLPYSRSFYHGLSGTAYDYKPNTAILFSAKNLHCTGMMASSKMGCTVQFTEDCLSNLYLT